ncbi:MAG: hypothetical protein H7X93_05535 [Sphingomonadaceae bacterium]|nr:hypothetical protein [Sphingomonadaceae bacterium]
MNTPDRRTGILSLDAKNMKVRLYDYDSYFYIENGTPVHLRLADNSHVSLHHTIVQNLGRSVSMVEPPLTTYYTDVLANTVVIGRKSWDYSSPIRRVWFSISHVKQLLANSRALEVVQRARDPYDILDKPLFEVRTKGLRVRCWYGVTGTWEFGANEWYPIFEIEFVKPRNLDTYLLSVHDLLQFFSAASGFQLTPSEISISTMTHAESLVSRDPLQKDVHLVTYIWPETEVESAEIHRRNSFVIAWSRSELAALKSCLKAWLSRGGDWRTATTLMMGSLGLAGRISGQRLLIACRWLEKIPGATALSIFSEEAIEEIVGAVTQKADSMGYAQALRRIKGALRSLRLEPNEVRFERLVRSVEAAFGQDAMVDHSLGETVIPALMQAVQLRGKEAHSIVGEQPCDLPPLQAATSAMEALCYLLTIKDLPMSSTGRERALSNRVVREYQYAAMPLA